MSTSVRLNLLMQHADCHFGFPCDPDASVLSYTSFKMSPTSFLLVCHAGTQAVAAELDSKLTCWLAAVALSE